MVTGMKAIIIALALLPFGAMAHAQDGRDEATYPREIRNDLRDARRQCTKIDEGKITFKPGLIRKLDLTGDGRDDYIVDLGELQCSTAETLYCGTGGCLHVIYVMIRKGALRKVFSGPVRAYKVSEVPGPKTITFDLHGGYCGKAGAEDCAKEKRITDQPFEFRDR